MLIEVLATIVSIEIFLTCFGLFVFAISYTTFFNWSKTAAGRSLLYFVLSLLMLVMVSVTRIFFGAEHPYFVYARGVVYTTLVFTTWHLVRVLWSSHRESEKPNPNPFIEPLKKPEVVKEN